MDIKRLITTIVGLPIVILILIYGSTYVMDILLMIIAIICMKEYFDVIEKVAHPIKWVGYASTAIIVAVSALTIQNIENIIMFGIPALVLILFLKVIITNMKTTFKDVAYTFLGICYVVFFIMFLGLIRGLEYGKIYLGYTVVVAWSTDIFAYLVGKKYGKHHFSKISPKKSIEGCIAGIVGAVMISLLYAYIVNSVLEFNSGYASGAGKIEYMGLQPLNISYIYIALVSFALSIISQVGDFVASSIKRFVDIKDYGNLLPGHGGMLDRVDSLIFIAPFVYMCVSLL